MGTLDKKKIEAVLNTAMRASADIVPLPNGGLSLVVQSTDFKKLDSAERQSRVWTALRKGLGPESARIGLVITLTPEEFASYNSPS